MWICDLDHVHVQIDGGGKRMVKHHGLIDSYVCALAVDAGSGERLGIVDYDGYLYKNIYHLLQAAGQKLETVKLLACAV